MTRSTCASCAHYAEPGTWSSPCLLIQWDWSKDYHWNVANRVRRADNSCARFEAIVTGPARGNPETLTCWGGAEARGSGQPELIRATCGEDRTRETHACRAPETNSEASYSVTERREAA